MTTYAQSAPALSAQGVYLPLNTEPREMMQAAVTAWRSGKKVKSGFSNNTRAGLETLAELVEAGTLHPVIDRVYPMTKIADAHRHVEGRHKRGSVIIAMPDV